MEERRETFTYTYSAAQQEEIKRIREKYAPPAKEEDKMERLRKLDREVTKPGLTAALVIGTVSTLVMASVQADTTVAIGSQTIKLTLDGEEGTQEITATLMDTPPLRNLPRTCPCPFT